MDRHMALRAKSACIILGGALLGVSCLVGTHDAVAFFRGGFGGFAPQARAVRAPVGLKDGVGRKRYGSPGDRPASA